MQYIVHQRFKGKTVSGNVNIPAMTICEGRDGVIYYDDKPICADMSACAHQHFAINDDGNGMLRGKLTTAIQNTLNKDRDKPIHQERWDKVWDDPRCQKYQRDDHPDHWLWNHAFFHASVEDLRYIANLIGAKEDK